MAKHDVEINDLYSFILPNLAKFSADPDNVHFTGSGNGTLASRVTAVLEAALAERDNQ